MKKVAESAGISRSQLVARLGSESTQRRKHYAIRNDEELLPLIMAVVNERPTYGYRRICAVLNRQFTEQGRPQVNHKRIYRIMRQNDLLLPRHTGKRTRRAHTGRVATEASNQRWCSDSFEFLCDDGKRIRVVFAIDAHDREIISYIATTGGITSQHVQDLMLECVERRFASHSSPHQIEWLNDNGSCYTAKETKAFASYLNLNVCYTPVRSPESNGMSEAFVKTIKRDYVYVNSRQTADHAMRMLPVWIDDYNEKAPHKSLGMLSPREFIRRNIFLAESGEGGVAVAAITRPVNRSEEAL